jgi:mono/diheme cytochrome c family protein
MYGLTLFVHSWLRWLLLATALVVAVRCVHGLLRKRPWSGNDRLFVQLFMRLFDLQITLGLLLYILLSPIVRAAFSDVGAAMKSSVLRFFLVEHITAVVIAVAIAHIGHARAQRATSSAQHHRRMLVTVLLWLLAVVVAIPWPFRPYGRPLARSSIEQAEPSANAPAVYLARCAACHGASGAGDGVAAGSMQPPPRDFRDPLWQRSISDAQLREVIVSGGTARGLSANMPAHPDLPKRELAALVRFVRSRAQKQSAPR